MISRRTFINRSIFTSTLLGLGSFPFESFAGDFTKLTILHTNDFHSRIEPFPAGSKYAGLGGVAPRAELIKKIRSKEKYVILLDSGDIFQGTPYFNYFRGRVEFESMSKMAYDAATLGNHDFDAGLDGLYKVLPYAEFPFLSANYDFSDTVLNGKIERYKTFQFGGLKIGVFGLGIELNGLVPTKLYGQTRYLDPIKIGNDTAYFLKNDLNCHFVICLSHLGYKYKESKISDVILAENSANIDLILGGHTHTFFRQPKLKKNKQNEQVIINQVGWAGIILGRIDVAFDRKMKKRKVFYDTVKVI